MRLELPAPLTGQTDADMLDYLTDAELLERFASGQEDAFAVLVRRHGDLVLGVCRRVLGNPHDAEDAFQAAFLVLARKAGTVRQSESLAGWLHRVAYRIALRARGNQARRRAGEDKARSLFEPAGNEEAPFDDLGELLDEEVHRLPEKYRVPVLLCYLQGRTNEEAARQMRCPTGTVKIRLLRARQMLRKRLARRGVGATLSALLALCAERAAASEPLLACTTWAGVRAAGGTPLAQAGVTSGAAGLAGGALKGMALARLKLAAAVLLTAALGAFADGMLQRAPAAESTAPAIKRSAPRPLLPYYEPAPARPTTNALPEMLAATVRPVPSRRS
jgi:RNA polymerase sigma factor (sigma-70 family)